MTSETQKDPSAIAHPAPLDLDAAIETCRLALAEIDWLQKSFGRARMMGKKSADGKAVIKEPMVYQGGSEYYGCMPNDALQAYSFWRLSGGREMMDYAQNSPGLYMKAPADLIVWANLQSIDKDKDYIFTEELIRDVLTKLNGVSEVIGVGKIFDDKVDDIFSGYTLEETHRDLLMYPFQAFRIEVLLQFAVSCDPDA